MLLFEDKVPNNKDAFIRKVIDVSAKLDILPNWLMAVMNSETGGTFSPFIVNPNGGATGLIQFMPRTATDLGTTTAELAHMSNVKQLDYVLKYFYDFRNYINSYEDLYLITFYPNADRKFASTLSKPDNWKFPYAVYAQNSGIDKDGKGYITIADFRKFAYAKLTPEARKLINESTGALVTSKKFVLRNKVPIAIISICFILSGILLIQSSKKK